MQLTPRCYSYIRFSSPEQMKGDSKRRQIAYADEYAKTNGLTLDDNLRITDYGLSAFHGHHRSKGALGKFLELVEEGSIPPGSHLVIEALDRLTRQEILEAVHLLSGLLLKDIVICTVADNQIYQREKFEIGELIISAVKLAQGHEESLKKQNRLKEVWKRKREDIASKKLKLTTNCPAWLEYSEKTGEFQPIPLMEGIVQRIFDMKHNGIGVSTIVKTLNHEAAGLAPGRRRCKGAAKKDCEWRESYIQKILRTRTVLGEFQPRCRTKDGPNEPLRMVNVGDSIKDYYPRIIDGDLFYAVQDQLEQNQKKGGRNGAVSNLFGHIAKCGYCGAPMAFINKGPAPKGGTYLICDKARCGAGCVRHPFRYPEFESLMLEFCQGLNVSDVVPDSDKTANETRQIKTRLAGIRGKLSDLETKTNNLTDSIASTADSRVRERLEKALSVIIDEQTVLSIEDKELDKRLKQLSSFNVFTSAQLSDIKAVIEGEGSLVYRARLRAKLRQLIKEITIYPAGTKRRLFQDISMSLAPETAQKVKIKLDAGGYDNKEQRAYVVQFATGNWRRIEPCKPVALTAEYDNTTGKTISIAWGPDGEPFIDIDYDQDIKLDESKYAPLKSG